MHANAAGWIDTHVHWDAIEFDPDRDAVLRRAYQAGVTCTLNPSVLVSGIQKIRAIAVESQQRADWPRVLPAYGIHPLYVDQVTSADLAALAVCIKTDRPIAIGEIGLDGYTGPPDIQQRQWFEDQLVLAMEFGLPVIMHVRHAVEAVIHSVKRVQGTRQRIVGGIAHAFNGSIEQAQQLIRLGFLMGFGGSLTYDGSTRIRRLAKELPLGSIVLETDAPDMPPAWLRQQRNEPAVLPEIARALAGLRGISPEVLRNQVNENLCKCLPALSGGPSRGAGAHTD